MPQSLLRSASTLLLHALVWALVAAMLIAQQPDYPGPKPPEFWLTQATVFGLLVGLFYLNVGWRPRACCTGGSCRPTWS